MKIRIKDVDIAYDDHGIGLPVIFLHAFPLNRSMWNGLTTALLEEQRYRLVAPDWRGFGESSLPNDISTMDLFANDLAALMDQLGMERAVVCGLSMGGYAALAFARSYAERLQGLILADTRPGVDDETGRAKREQLARLAEKKGVEAVADAQMSRLLSEHTLQHIPEVEARVRQMIALATPAGIAAASRGMARRVDQNEILPGISCPTLVIAGEQDSITPPGEVQAYAARIPGARVSILPHAGHLSNLEQPAAFLEEVRVFLATI